MLTNRSLHLLGCGLLLGLAGLSRLEAEPIPSLAVYTGRFEILNQDTSEVGLEWRGSPRRFRGQPRWLPDLWPIVGGMATSRNDVYVYAGVAAPFSLTPDGSWTLTPSFAPGLYSSGATDLGGPIEFRSAVSLSYRLGPETWLGLAFYHLSNAGLYRPNPGSESLVLSVVQRFGRARYQ